MHRRDRIRLDWLDTDNVQLYIFAICNCLNYFVGKWKLERQQKNLFFTWFLAGTASSGFGDGSGRGGSFFWCLLP